MDIFRLSGMKYPIHILAPTFSTVSLEMLRTASTDSRSFEPVTAWSETINPRDYAESI